MLDDIAEVEEMKILIEESVLRQALEAFELLRYWNKTEPADKAITALRTALDAAEKVGSSSKADSEPVAWIDDDLNLRMGKPRVVGPLYTHPAPAVPEEQRIVGYHFSRRNPLGQVVWDIGHAVHPDAIEWYPVVRAAPTPPANTDSELREAARNAVEAYEDGGDIWGAIDRLRKAL